MAQDRGGQGGRRLSKSLLQAKRSTPGSGAFLLRLGLERFPAKWKPVRVKKTRQIKNLEPRSDFIGTEKALARPGLSRAGTARFAPGSMLRRNQ
jgi:hypothetical protein